MTLLTHLNTAVSISIQASLEELSKIEALIENLHEEGVVTEEVFGNLMVATTEAVLNAINHGSKGDQSKQVNFDLRADQDELEVVVSDSGKGFDFNNLPDPTDPDFIQKGSGRGVFIMKNLADEVEFEENGARVKMTFSLKEKVPTGA